MLPVMSTFQRAVAAIGLQTLAGLVVWAIVAAVGLAFAEPALGLTSLLLLFGQLVVVPLGLGLLRLDGGPASLALVRGARFGWRLAALAALVAVAIPPGALSAAVAALWLVPALAVGLAAVLSLPVALRDPVRFAHAAAAGFLVVGALFFVLHRGGGDWAGVGPTIVQLTAVHFHVAGFGLALVTAELVERRRRIGTAAILLLVAGMALTALGFLTVRPVQAAGAVLVAVALLVAAVGIAGLGHRIRSAAARWLLRISCASGFAVAGLALVYAITEAAGRPAIDIPTMAATHGVLAALGVVGAGLIGWRVEGR